MTAFTNQPIKTTYGDIVQLGNSGAGVSASLLTVQDGLGNSLPYQLSSTAFNVTGTFTVAGSAVLTASSTAILTNKTYDTAGTGNVFKINGTQVSAVTGTGAVVLANGPTITLANAIGLPVSTGISGFGSGVATALAVNTGSSGAFVVNGGALGTPSSGTLTNCTGLVPATGLSAVTGSGSAVLATSPTIATPIIAQINDTNSNKMVVHTTTASAVNYVNITNNSTTNAPIIAAAGTDTNVALAIQGQGTSGVNIKGVTAVASAPAGYVGEIITATAAAGSVSLTTFTPANVTSISLTAGDWDLTGQVNFTTTSSTSVTLLETCINTTSATFPASNPTNSSLVTPAVVPGAGTDYYLPSGTLFLNVSSTTTVYLVVQAAFTASTLSAGGTLQARRRR